MIGAVFLSLAMMAAPAGAQQPGRPATMLNLSCVEALVAIDQANLAGVFSFVSEKDGPLAFADLIVRDKKAMKKFLAKLDKDRKEVQAISTWDREAVIGAVSIYGSPLAETLEKPASDTMERLNGFVATQAIPLSDLTARRRKA